MFEAETEYGDMNAWVELIKYTIQNTNHSDCYASSFIRMTCSSGSTPSTRVDSGTPRDVVHDCPVSGESRLGQQSL